MNTEKNRESGFIQIYTGEGKGKTTASLGLAFRAIGAGKKVAIVFFDKGGEIYNERKVLDRFKGEIDYFVSGRNRIKEDEFDFSITKEDINQAHKGLEIAKEISSSGKYDILILDEINNVVSLGMIEVQDIISFLKTKPYYLELVLTGRNCSDVIMEQADLVTEMKEVKHYYKKGVKARNGVEY